MRVDFHQTIKKSCDQENHEAQEEGMAVEVLAFLFRPIGICLYAVWCFFWLVVTVAAFVGMVWGAVALWSWIT